MKKIIDVPYAGRRKQRIGENNPKALLSDEEVELIRQMHEENLTSLASIGRAFGVSRSYVWNIVHYHRRCATPDGWKKYEVTVCDETGAFTAYREI